MKSTTVLLLLVSLLWADLTNIAVHELKPIGISEDESALITERLRTEIVQLGLYDVMERAEMNIIVQEMAFQQSGMCDESACLVELGQILGVEKIISGTVGKIGNLYTISLKLINVETALIENSVSEDNRNGLEDFYMVSLRKVSLKLADKKGTSSTPLVTTPTVSTQSTHEDSVALYNLYRISPTGRINGERPSIRRMIHYSARINSSAESEYRKAKRSLWAGTILALSGLIAISNNGDATEKNSAQISVGLTLTGVSLFPLMKSIRKSARAAEIYDEDLQKYYGVK